MVFPDTQKLRGLTTTAADSPASHDMDNSAIEHDNVEQVSIASSFTCYHKNLFADFGIYDPTSPETTSNRVFLCNSLVTPGKQLNSNLQGANCACQSHTERGVTGAKWKKYTSGRGGGEEEEEEDGDGEVNAQFFGNIVGHAKMLCQIVESIDCWQNKNPGLKIPGLNSIGNQDGFTAIGEPQFVAITTADGDQKFAAQADIIGTIKKICKVVDGGIGALPGLLPDLLEGGGGGSLPGIPGLLSGIISGLTGGGGGGGIIDLVKDLFGSIFMVPGDSTAAQVVGDGQIRVYDELPANSKFSE